MAQTTALAPTTAAGQTTDIVVAAGATVAISVYSTDAPTTYGTPYLGQLTLLRKIGTAYYPVPDETGSIAFLGDQKREIVVNAPGTYAVSKPITQFNVGVNVDS